MSNPEAPRRYRSPHRRDEARHAQTTQDVAPQFNDRVIPTWMDTNEIIVKTKARQADPRTIGGDPSELDDLRYKKACLKVFSIVPVVSVLGAAYFATNKVSPETGAAVAKKMELQSVYQTLPNQDANIPNTTPFVLDIRTTETGAACWKKYTTNASDSGTINTTLLADCFNQEIQALPNPMLADASTITALLLVGSGMAALLAIEARRVTKRLALLSNNQPRP